MSANLNTEQFSESIRARLRDWLQNPVHRVESNPRQILLLASILYGGSLLYLAMFPIAAVWLTANLPARMVAASTQLDLISLYAQAVVAIVCMVTSVQLLRPLRGKSAANPLTREQAPDLFKLIDALRKHYHAARIDEVVLTEDAAIRIEQIPACSIPVGGRNRMLLGLPLMQMLSPEHVRAQLARAIGAQAGPENAWLGTLLRLRMHFRGLQMQLRSTDTLSMFLISAAVRMFAPLHAWLDPALDDMAESAGDQNAQDLVNGEDLVASIVAVASADHYLNAHYWPMIWRMADRAERPEARPYTNLATVYRLQAAQTTLRRQLRDAVRHPSESATAGNRRLQQRLDRLGYRYLVFPSVPEHNAADLYLDGIVREKSEQFDTIWSQREAQRWERRHSRSKQARMRLGELQSALDQQGLHGDEAMEYAALSKRYRNQEEAITAYKRVAEQNPEDPRLLFGVGRYLLGVGDNEGIELLETAMQVDKRLLVQACKLISEFRSDQRKTVEKEHQPTPLYTVDTALSA